MQWGSEFLAPWACTHWTHQHLQYIFMFLTVKLMPFSENNWYRGPFSVFSSVHFLVVKPMALVLSAPGSSCWLPGTLEALLMAAITGPLLSLSLFYSVSLSLPSPCQNKASLSLPLSSSLYFLPSISPVLFIYLCIHVPSISLSG